MSDISMKKNMPIPIIHTQVQKNLLLVDRDFTREGTPCIDVLSANQSTADFFLEAISSSIK